MAKYDKHLDQLKDLAIETSIEVSVTDAPTLERLTELSRRGQPLPESYREETLESIQVYDAAERERLSKLRAEGNLPADIRYSSSYDDYSIVKKRYFRSIPLDDEEIDLSVRLLEVASHASVAKSLRFFALLTKIMIAITLVSALIAVIALFS